MGGISLRLICYCCSCIESAGGDGRATVGAALGAGAAIGALLTTLFIAATRCTVPAPSLRVPMNGAPRRLVIFLLRQKSNQKRRIRRAAFCFLGFCCRAISAAYRASSTTSLLPSFEICITA